MKKSAAITAGAGPCEEDAGAESLEFHQGLVTLIPAQCSQDSGRGSPGFSKPAGHARASHVSPKDSWFSALASRVLHLPKAVHSSWAEVLFYEKGIINENWKTNTELVSLQGHESKLW